MIDSHRTTHTLIGRRSSSSYVPEDKLPWWFGVRSVEAALGTIPLALMLLHRKHHGTLKFPGLIFWLCIVLTNVLSRISAGIEKREHRWAKFLFISVSCYLTDVSFMYWANQTAEFVLGASVDYAIVERSTSISNVIGNVMEVARQVFDSTFWMFNFNLSNYSLLAFLINTFVATKKVHMRLNHKFYWLAIHLLWGTFHNVYLLWPRQIVMLYICRQGTYKALVPRSKNRILGLHYSLFVDGVAKIDLQKNAAAEASTTKLAELEAKSWDSSKSPIKYFGLYIPVLNYGVISVTDETRYDAICDYVHAMNEEIKSGRLTYNLSVRSCQEMCIRICNDLGRKCLMPQPYEKNLLIVIIAYWVIVNRYLIAKLSLEDFLPRKVQKITAQ